VAIPSSNPQPDMNGDGDRPTVDITPKRRKASWPLIILATLFIIVPFFTWYGTWFGRKLSDDDVAKYLADNQNPRHIQHALSLIEERIEGGDSSAKKFYPQVIAQAKNPIGEVRKTAAWVMGQDNTSAEFHQTLLSLLDDSEPLVRRNAALQLVRFGDASGRPEFRAMLQPFEAKSPIAGTLSSLLPEGSTVKSGGLLARIRDASGNVQEFRAPVDGAIRKVEAKEGDAVAENQTLARLTPDRSTVIDALRALLYVGTGEDLPLLEAYSANTENEAALRDLATQADKTIRTRGDKANQQ
jgi:hypothetical protein